MSFGITISERELGNYELLQKIAEGGMGTVYKGRHKVSRQVVAIKVIPPETARNPVLLRRFEQEFRVAALIDHPNVVRAIEYCGLPPTPFLVMEFVDGKSLGDLVEQCGPMTEDAAVGVMAQICDGLHRAHKQGLIHRDVKPDNILLDASGAAKLTDLGLVKDIEADDNLTRTGKGLGTPHFMAPEQFRDAKNADVRCDVYSLGATLYTLVTGRIPFAGSSPLDCWVRKSRNDFPAPKSVVPLLSDRTDFAIRRAMAASPAGRPASCREFMEDLIGETWRPAGGAGLTDSTGLPPVDGSTLWYMVTRDENGQPKKLKANTDSIRRTLQVGGLGDPQHILVCRTKEGPFAPLHTVPAFRDLVLNDKLLTDSAVSDHSLGGPSKGRLNPPSKTRLNPPSKTRLNEEAGPPSSHLRRVPAPAPVPSVTVPTPIPAARSRLEDGTDEVSSVPLTDSTNLHLDSAERPHLPLHGSEPTLTVRALVWLFLLGAGLGMAAFLLTR